MGKEKRIVPRVAGASERDADTRLNPKTAASGDNQWNWHAKICKALCVKTEKVVSRQFSGEMASIGHASSQL
jgi:hypothetical protein